MVYDRLLETDIAKNTPILDAFKDSNEENLSDVPSSTI